MAAIIFIKFHSANPPKMTSVLLVSCLIKCMVQFNWIWGPESYPIQLKRPPFLGLSILIIYEKEPTLRILLINPESKNFWALVNDVFS